MATTTIHFDFGGDLKKSSDIRKYYKKFKDFLGVKQKALLSQTL